MQDQETRILYEKMQQIEKSLTDIRALVHLAINEDLNRYLSVSDAAKFASVSRHTIYGWIRRKVDNLEYHQPEGSGAVLIKKYDLVKYIERNSARKGVPV